MLCITLADGSNKQFPGPVSVRTVAQAIGPVLSKSAIAAEVDGKLVDLSYQIESDAKLKIVTAEDARGLEIIRHSAAHLLAHALKSLYDNVKIAIGPVVEDGFYYDFSCDHTMTPEDLGLIEKKMKELAKADYPIERKVLSRNEAIELFSQLNEPYKLEIIKEISEHDQVSVYQQDNFIDLCRGPHVARTGQLCAFKLTKLAGAYWRGDSNNVMLQRIYGTAWPNQKSLDDYLLRIVEAEKRDHRKLAKKMDLFHLQAEAPGMVFWHPNGWTIVRTLREYLHHKLHEFGYQEVNTPQLVDINLWVSSGHFEKFENDLFTCQSENREYAIKPMSCPCHVQIFKQGLKSYRDLPIRLAEFGACHRNEPSGTLHGLMRVRGFVQDDAHIFCTPQQIEAEVLAFIKQLHQVYADLGFTDIIHKLSTHPEKRIGSDDIWDMAERILATALDTFGAKWEMLSGEGAFYGPKIEFSLRDCLGRVWQCGTMQIDFFTAGRLEAHYIDEDGVKQVPIMLHRAMLGSLERFIAILLEQYAHQLPLWLAPIQVVVINITDKHVEYVKEIAKQLDNLGIRVNLDLRNEKVGYKIREHTIARIPYQIIVGDREMVDRTVSVRKLDGSSSETLTLAKFAQNLHDEIEQKK